MELELYYKFEPNKYFTISSSVQYFVNPQGSNVENKNDVLV
ncbi:MAG: carbohydrate porin [Endomicrobium sp.]|nr:carbohydrate porin [Endomicrobium sp.]